MRTLLIAASLLTLGVLGASPAAACTSPLGPAGTAGGGVLGYTEWYVRADGESACAAEGGVETAVGQEIGQAQAGALAAVAAAGNLVHAGTVVGAAQTFVAATTGAAQSQVFDTCSTLIGPVNPPCLTDVPVSSTQWCAAALPQTFGGLVAETTENANGVLQAVCQVYNAPSVVPSNAEVQAFQSAATNAVGTVAGAPLDIASGAAQAAGGLANNALVNTCVWLAANPACLS
jgi:hypothetical protein